MNMRDFLTAFGRMVRRSATTPANCHLCSAEVKRPFHIDDAPTRVYCSSCSQCSRYHADDRCDACFARYYGRGAK